MRRATLVVAAAGLMLSSANDGRVAALATLVAFTSSAVVLFGGLTAARPAAGSLPTAGVFWWGPLAPLVVTSTLVLFMEALSD